MVTIRLSRGGSKKRPFYSILVADQRRSLRGRFIERVGFYNPIAAGREEKLRINTDRIDYWLGLGAQPSERVTQLYKQAGKVVETPLPTAKAESAPKPVSATKPNPAPEPTPESAAESTAKSESTPASAPVAASKPDPAPEPTPESAPKLESAAESTAKSESTPASAAKSDSAPASAPEPTPESAAKLESAAESTAESESTPESESDPKPASA